VAPVTCLNVREDGSGIKPLGFRIYCFALRVYDSHLTCMKLVLCITIRHPVIQIS
jgi:hypothetical protein